MRPTSLSWSLLILRASYYTTVPRCVIIPWLEPSDHASDARSGMQAYSHLELEVLLGLYPFQLEQHAERVLHHRHRMILFFL